MTFPIRFKDPQAVLDYSFNWSDWLSEIGDTIASSTWTIPDGITSVSQSNTTTRATVILSGGTSGTQYTIRNHITTAGGKQDDRSMIIMIADR
jgi:hypothetical protein